MPPQKVTLPAGTPYQVQQAFDRLYEHAAQIERQNGDLQAQVSGLPKIYSLDDIRNALQAGGSHPLNLQNLQGLPATANPNIPSSGSSGGGGGGGDMAPAPYHFDIVQAVWAELGITSGSSAHDLFKFAQTVVWRIAQVQTSTDPKAGLLMQAGGDGTYNCGGTIFATFRFMYDNGANIKILTGSYQPQWTQEANVSTSDWHAPTDPATVCP